MKPWVVHLPAPADRAQVLHKFPTTIRRRILRHLYLHHFRNAYLFKGVRQKFIDALLGVARIELFMPQASAPVLAVHAGG